MGNQIGWIISLSTDAYQSTINERKNYPYLSWSPYDRVAIKKVQKFPDFFEKEGMPEWNGTVQQLHLYPIQESKFQWQIGEHCLINDPGRQEKQRGLYCILTTQFKKRMENISFLKQEICDKLQIVLKNKQVEWTCFESLGSEDFVTVFLADKISILAEAMDTVKKLKFETNGKKEDLFDSICSFLGLNDPEFCAEPDANLLVRLNLISANACAQAVSTLQKELKEILNNESNSFSIKHILLGKHCLEIDIKNNANVFNCFKDQMVFNGSSDFYKKFVENSRSYWYVNTTDTNENSIFIPAKSQIQTAKTPSETSLDTIKQPIVKFILKEFKRLINSNRCLNWSDVLKKQYTTYLACAQEYIQTGNQKALCSINNKVQTMLLHINQATAPLHEIPYHNYYYSGSYSDVLQLYYGIINSYFLLGYGIERQETTIQYNVTFCVDFESAVKVHSSMYKMQTDPRRFVVFHLPYKAFTDFARTTQLLAHEVFHYIAPINRGERNFNFIKGWTITIFEQCVRILQKNDHLKAQEIQPLFELFYENFGFLTKDIREELERNGYAQDFYQMILNDFESPYKNNLRKLVMYIVIQIILKWLNQQEEPAFQKLKEQKIQNDLYEQLSCNLIHLYLKESLQVLSKAEKEVFCDLNMIRILNLSMQEYINLVYFAFFDGEREEIIIEKIKDLLQKGIQPGSIELRIGMIFDIFLQSKVQSDSIEQYIYALKKEFEQIVYKKDNLLHEFCHYLEQIYAIYLQEHSRKRQIYKEFFDGINRYWEEHAEKNSELKKQLREAAFVGDGIPENMAVIKNFTEKFHPIELTKNRNSVFEKEPSTHINYISYDDRQFVSSVGEYVSTVCKYAKIWNKQYCWYRGLCSHTFSLTPSLFRRLDLNLSLYANQARYLKDAYYETMSIPSLWTEQLSGIAEHTCCLQHYGMPTNLLDFSMDMLISLHFALNPDIPDDLAKVDNGTYQPEIILFNPKIYSDAIRSLEQGKPVKKLNNISPVLFDVTHEDLSEYFVGDMSAENLASHSAKYTEPYVPNTRTNKYPRPVVIRQSNERVLAQSGTFLAFNLNAQPAKDFNDHDINNQYKYLDLRIIQQEYNQLLENHCKCKEDGQFIKSIYIDTCSVPEIKKELEIMGITAPRVYPELFRVFQDYVKKMETEKTI